ncbi:MAG: DUF4962 domain-containing protein [Kiritimatiellaeota bacterium]|nr:DUF4962 domain-containing protein [Kiritimatiellota bacterium]
MKPRMFTLAALLLAPLVALLAADAPPSPQPNIQRISPSELRIECGSLLPKMLDKPIPQGVVDVNPPWLHVYVPVVDGTETTNRGRKAKTATQKWNRRFYFKLAQDPELKKDVIESGPKRWSFFNPFRRLATGRWYWTYGLAPAESPDKPVWHKAVFSFVINGSEFAPAIPPTADDLLAAIKKRKTGPVTICTSEDIGHLLPTNSWPELTTQLQENCRKALKAGAEPVKMEISDKEYPAYMKDGPKAVYFIGKMRALFCVEERRIDALLRGYLLTGEEQYKKLGIQRAIELEQLRKTKRYSILGQEDTLEKHALYNTVPLLMVDAFYDDLPPAQQQPFLALVEEVIGGKSGGSSPDMHEMIEHVFFNQHAWQQKVQNLLMGAIILCRYKPEYEDWVKYAYEVWLYRSPALSRTDGGSMDGNGYLAVHDEPLTHSGWVLHRLTGFNFFQHKRWFANFPTYMSIVNAHGNPGPAFCDGGDGGADVSYLGEMLAYLCPEIPCSGWRFKSVGRRDLKYFAADMNKGNRAWDMLSLWNRYPPPNVATAHPPGVLAACFRDVGVAAMHTDLTDPSRNLVVNFNSAPAGSYQHVHPAQNAFGIAYGGEPLFWRTGYYNGGGEHDILSYKCSRAHNTILAGGMVQGFDVAAYGWLPRFATGQRISYVLGDASQAYTGTYPKYTNRKTPVEVPITPAYGFGKPGVTRFRRHVVLLRPSHVLIYDELTAEKPITWTFQLHSLKPITQLGNAWFKGANAHAIGSARLFCVAPVTGSVTDKFLGTPVDEENKRKGQNPPNWHVTITTKDALPATRFLTIIEVTPTNEPNYKLIEPIAEGTGRIRLRAGDFTVIAELDAGQPAFLSVRSDDGKCALVTGPAAEQLQLGGETRTAKLKGSTLLLEKETSQGDIFVEESDHLPDALIYGNLY